MTSPKTAAEARPNDSARGAIIAGAGVLLVFFGGFGTWAATAPLNGAVVGEAIVKVDGNRKSVQHLEGGIVSEIRVKDGDPVREGDVLIVLDDGQTRAEYEIVDQQMAMLSATEARLKAELADAGAVVFPAELLQRKETPHVGEAIRNQISAFENRRSALLGEVAIVEQRIAQLDEQIKGGEAQARTYQEQLASVTSEEQSLSKLLSEGFVSRTRVLQLQRTAAGLSGQLEAARASTAQARSAIGEHRKRIEQLRKDRAAEAARELSDVQWRLQDAAPRARNARARLDRSEIRSPYSGTVVGLNVFSVGGVVSPGQRLLDVVPEGTELIVEARIAVQDISDIRPGMSTEVHFTSYKQRIIPLIHGRVAEISADRLTDERTQIPYYTAQVAVNQDELADSPEIQLYPGMPATVMITTRERTALDYLVGPLVESFDRAFRER